MKQLTLIRDYVRNRLVSQLRAWISCLPETELEALTKLQDPRTAEAIADHVVHELGHRTPSNTVSTELPRPRGRPRKVGISV